MECDTPIESIWRSPVAIAFLTNDLSFWGTCVLPLSLFSPPETVQDRATINNHFKSTQTLSAPRNKRLKDYDADEDIRNWIDASSVFPVRRWLVISYDVIMASINGAGYACIMCNYGFLWYAVDRVKSIGNDKWFNEKFACKIADKPLIWT